MIDRSVVPTLSENSPRPGAPVDHPRGEATMRSFRDPSSVAVVGASDDPAKWGYRVSRGALCGAGRRDVYLVNGRGGDANLLAEFDVETGLGFKHDLDVAGHYSRPDLFRLEIDQRRLDPPPAADTPTMLLPEPSEES